ncbi:hypothetical protein DI43_00915 [Geobacillus sp. CAMR12739]|nr:hypothetical protein DI43_00915 [Geobacillus sp. CAMR12739]
MELDQKLIYNVLMPLQLLSFIIKMGHKESDSKVRWMSCLLILRGIGRIYNINCNIHETN